MDIPGSRLTGIATRRDTPEVDLARFAALTRQIPMMYIVLIINTWTVSWTFHDQAPPGLTVYASALLTVLFFSRLVVWHKKRAEAPTPETARRALRTAYAGAAVAGVSLVTWGLALFPYGDALARGHIALHLAVSVLVSALCLIHAVGAAWIAVATASVPTLVFFALRGGPVLTTMAVNSTLVAAVVLAVVVMQNRDFVRMVQAQVEAVNREQEQSRLLRMIDDMPIAVMTTDRDAREVTYVNEAYRRLLRKLGEALPGAAGREVVGLPVDAVYPNPEGLRRLAANPGLLPYTVRAQIGSELLDVQISTVTRKHGGFVGLMLAWRIVTEDVAAQERIRELAHNDGLTGLPNRNTFRAYLEEALVRTEFSVSVLFVDLDGFKTINDTLGHRAGDELLGQVARRLRHLRLDAGSVVGRLGGDEFAILLPGADRASAEACAASVIDLLRRPYRLDRHRQVRVGASIGIALHPDHGSDSETLLSHADIALYDAKAAGHSLVRTFSPEMESRITHRVELEAALRSALEHREGLFVFYQPIVDAATGVVTTREALARWYHPDRGWIPPSEFVPIAEANGLIEQLGRFVLEEACRTAGEWDDGARVAVNVSAEQLGRGTLVPTVLDAMARAGLAPDRLEVEVTETALLGREGAGASDLHQLRDAGVHVALDDFGTGYSSLYHLRAFPFDKIKIDGSFVRDAVDRPDCAAVVHGVAALGRALGATTVAEGVETQDQLDRARAEGCVEIQGYIYGRPAPAPRDVARVDALNRTVAVERAAVSR